MLVSFFVNDYFLCKEICIIVVTTIAMKIYTRRSTKRVFVLAAIFQAILIIIDYLMVGFQSIFLAGIDTTSGYAGILVLILTKTILFFVVVLIKSILGKREFNILQDAEWLKFMFFPLFSIVMISAMLSDKTYSLRYQYRDLFIVIAFGLIGMNIAVFYLVCDVAQKEKVLRENQILEWEAENKLKLYEQISENVKKQRMLSHEFRNQINIIQGLCEGEQINELKKYLTDLNGTFQGDINCFETRNVIVNTVLNEKYYSAVDNGILFVCMTGDMSGLRISDQDIALILSNLLNNAIEACQQCSEKKMIKIKMLNKESNFILSIRNTYCGNICRKDDQFLSTKQNDNGNHGYGLKNVIKVIKKYGGEYVIKTNENEFVISINIPHR